MTFKGAHKIKSFSAAKIRSIDQQAIQRYGIPSLVLMENAGRAVSDEVLRQLKPKKIKRAIVLCGAGNNAGDGFVAARYLMNAGIAVDTFIVGGSGAFKADPKVNLNMLKNTGAKIYRIKNIDQRFKKIVDRSAVIVDAIFGIGLNRDIDGSLSSIIDLINHAKKRIIAVDVPSGLDATTGKVLGNCIRADMTITFTAAKNGFYRNAGPAHTGRVKVIDIGIPKKLLK